MFNVDELVFLRNNRKNNFYIKFGVYSDESEIISAMIQSKITFCNKDYLDTKFVKRLITCEIIEKKEYTSDSEVIYVINNKNLNEQLDLKGLNKFVVSKQEQKLIDYLNLFYLSNKRVEIFINTLDKESDAEFITDKIVTRLDRNIIDSLVDKGILYKVANKDYFNKLDLHHKFKKS